MRPLSVISQIISEYLLILSLKKHSRLFPIPPESWNTGSTGNVILIHGVWEPWNFLFDIGDYLNKMGYKIHIIPELKDNTLPLFSAAEMVSGYISDHKLSDLILICHSKGGLIAYNLLSNPKINSLIKLVISISTPYHGSHVGLFHPASIELIPKSPVIKKLETIKVDRTKIHAIHSRIDNHSIPHNGLHLEGAHNYELDIVGHTRILVSPKTQKLISDILKNPTGNS